jgi:hypothetical protein
LIRNFLLQIGVLSAPQKDWKVKDVLPNLKVTNLTFFYLWELQRVTIFKKFKAHHDRIPAFRPPVSIALVPVAHVAWKMSMALKAP